MKIVPLCWDCWFERWGDVVVLRFCTSPFVIYWDNGDVFVNGCCCDGPAAIVTDDWLEVTSLQFFNVFWKFEINLEIRTENLLKWLWLPIFKMWIASRTKFWCLCTNVTIVVAACLHIIWTRTICWHWMMPMMTALLFTQIKEIRLNGR